MRRGTPRGVRRPETSTTAPHPPLAHGTTSGTTGGTTGGTTVATTGEADTLASWTTQQLVAFLGAVSACRDESSAVQTAAEAVAIATDAEIGAVVLGGQVISCIGFGRSTVPVRTLVEACGQSGTSLEVPGLGSAEIAVAELGRVPGGYLLAARARDPFGAGERGMISAMANVLSLTLDVLRALDAERSARESSEQTTAQVTQLLAKVREQRQLTLDRFSRIQRAITARRELSDVLDAITEAACELVECDVAVLRVTDGIDATTGVEGPLPDAASPEGIGRSVEQSGTPQVNNDFAATSEAASFGEPLVQAMVATPILQGSGVVGHLLLGSRDPSRTFAALDESLAITLAEQAALAVQDAQTVGALHTALEDARHEATHDALTGLANRARFMAALGVAVAPDMAEGDEAASDGEASDADDRAVGRPCVLYIDLDYFKQVNDTHGHLVGDQLLVVTASRLLHAVREGDVVARLGGDEFAILLTSVDSEAEAQALAQRVFVAVCRPAQLHGESLWPSASVGVAPALPGDTSTTIIARADLALYSAKRNGRSQVAMYRDELGETSPPGTSSPAISPPGISSVA